MGATRLHALDSDLGKGLQRGLGALGVGRVAQIPAGWLSAKPGKCSGVKPEWTSNEGGSNCHPLTAGGRRAPAVVREDCFLMLCHACGL